MCQFKLKFLKVAREGRVHLADALARDGFQAQLLVLAHLHQQNASVLRVIPTRNVACRPQNFVTTIITKSVLVPVQASES